MQILEMMSCKQHRKPASIQNLVYSGDSVQENWKLPPETSYELPEDDVMSLLLIQEETDDALSCLSSIFIIFVIFICKHKYNYAKANFETN